MKMERNIQNRHEDGNLWEIHAMTVEQLKKKLNGMRDDMEVVMYDKTFGYFEYTPTNNIVPGKYTQSVLGGEFRQYKAKNRANAVLIF